MQIRKALAKQNKSPIQLTNKIQNIEIESANESTK